MQPDLTVHVTDKQFKAVAAGIHLSEVQEAMGELEHLCQRKIDSAADFTNAVKLAALKAHVEPSVLAQFITAKVNNKAGDVQRKAEQLEMLFAECP